MTKIATDKSDVVILTSDNPKNEDPCMYSIKKKCNDQSELKSVMMSRLLFCPFQNL